MAQGDNVVAAMLTSAVANRVSPTVSESELPTAIVRLFLDIEAALSRERGNKRLAAQQALAERRSQPESSESISPE